VKVKGLVVFVKLILPAFTSACKFLDKSKQAFPILGFIVVYVAPFANAFST
jgi:hypothetical protein